MSGADGGIDVWYVFISIIFHQAKEKKNGLKDTTQLNYYLFVKNSAGTVHMCARVCVLYNVHIYSVALIAFDLYKWFLHMT